MPFDPDGDQEPEVAAYDAPSAFDPYNPSGDSPESVQPTSSSPAQSSDAPGFGDTSGADGEPPEQAPQGTEEPPDEEPLPEFDPRWTKEFEGLLYLGRLTDTFTLWGHTFVIRTLTTEELAEVGLIVAKYQGTRAENAVYQAAIVAASVVTVDGQPLPRAITVDTTDELATVKFPYVMRNWMPPVKEAVYNKSFGLELKVRQVLAALGEPPG
jgi:hypothetical protein